MSFRMNISNLLNPTRDSAKCSRSNTTKQSQFWAGPPAQVSYGPRPQPAKYNVQQGRQNLSKLGNMLASLPPVSTPNGKPRYDFQKSQKNIRTLSNMLESMSAPSKKR
ncbi:hypothetical protein QC762_0105030 [Podospora pseudocomata]|uniref:Uncharacterized protein n=1 Tax=Podospora pseudocomata TaxID=2093779 RepID=A0ABR0G2I4_9PEZI|nr:hypothetical protein QC762_0105030 [Podospora pseudocomata]